MNTPPLPPLTVQTADPWQQFFSACWTEYDAMMARRRARELAAQTRPQADTSDSEATDRPVQWAHEPQLEQQQGGVK